MERLLATQQYDLALQTAHFVFDPTIGGDSLDRCWLFPPFKSIAGKRINSVEDTLKSLQASTGDEKDMTMTIREWRANPFNAHVVARGRPDVYMRRFVMKYVEILIAAGDEYFRQNTLETIPLALQRYVEASHIFGQAPSESLQFGNRSNRTYAQLEAQLNNFSNAAFDMEIEFPFFSGPASRGTIGASDNTVSLTGILKTTYFCVSSNPKLAELRSLIDDRLYKIRNCQGIDGNVRRLSLFEPPIDPGLLVRATAKGISLSEILNDTIGPMPNYRFQYLLTRASDLCAELKSLGSTYLSIKEKRDSEALSILRSRQDRIIQSMIIDLKQLAIKEAEASITAMEETRKAQVTRLAYYLALAGDTSYGIPEPTSDWQDIVQSIEEPSSDDLRMTLNERLEMDKAEEAADMSQKATILDITSAVIKAIPSISKAFEPLGMGVQIGAITSNIADSLGIMAMAMRFQGEAKNVEGARASRKGGLIRQLQERRMQANAAGREIKGTDKQMETLKVRLDTCNTDIKLQQQQVAHAAEMEDWLKNKYTNEQLYAWMDSSLRNLYYQAFVLANDLAKKAQKAFRFERGGRRLLGQQSRRAAFGREPLPQP